MSIRGKVVVFTGRISRPRHEFQTLVERNGGIASDSVTRSTDLLVVGEDPGSKLAKATLLGVKVISEAKLLVLMGEEQEEEEVPLSPKELQEVLQNLVTLKCKWCGSEYKQWSTLPDYSTCPVCEIKSLPRCPRCLDAPIFVTSYKNCYCFTCKLFFEAPYSERVCYTEHVHILDPNGKCVACRKTNPPPIKVFETEFIKLSRESAGKRERGLREANRLSEEKALSFIESLTDEKREQLREQLAQSSK